MCVFMCIYVHVDAFMRRCVCVFMGGCMRACVCACVCMADSQVLEAGQSSDGGWKAVQCVGAQITAEKQ